MEETYWEWIRPILEITKSIKTFHEVDFASYDDHPLWVEDSTEKEMYFGICAYCSIDTHLFVYPLCTIESLRMGIRKKNNPKGYKEDQVEVLTFLGNEFKCHLPEDTIVEFHSPAITKLHYKFLKKFDDGIEFRFHLEVILRPKVCRLSQFLNIEPIVTQVTFKPTPDLILSEFKVFKKMPRVFNAKFVNESNALIEIVNRYDSQGNPRGCQFAIKSGEQQLFKQYCTRLFFSYKYIRFAHEIIVYFSYAARMMQRMCRNFIRRKVYRMCEVFKDIFPKEIRQIILEKLVKFLF